MVARPKPSAPDKPAKPRAAKAAAPAGSVVPEAPAPAKPKRRRKTGIIGPDDPIWGIVGLISDPNMRRLSELKHRAPLPPEQQTGMPVTQKRHSTGVIGPDDPIWGIVGLWKGEVPPGFSDHKYGTSTCAL